MIHDWRKSSYSSTPGGDCVEVRDRDTQVDVRDSKNPDAGFLTFDREAWQAFLADAEKL